jgi:hypothetical protein
VVGDDHRAFHQLLGDGPRSWRGTGPSDSLIAEEPTAVVFRLVDATEFSYQMGAESIDPRTSLT